MLRILSRTVGSLLLATLAACSAAYSDGARPGGAAPQAGLVVAGGPAAPVAAPYGVEVLAEDGTPMATYNQDGRFYVLGEAGSRYLIRVSNPTDRRVEAVVTVDGLDVIDGESGDLRKRGYVVPPYGEVRIEGFRTSTSEVATFRFSSVDASYAGRKGKARNVGVIAVALFDETAPAQIILDEPEAPPPVTYYDGGDYGGSDEDSGGGGGYYRRDSGSSGGSADKKSADRPASGGGGGESSGAVMRPPPPPDGEYEVDDYQPDYAPTEERCCAKDKGKKRGGLGTEYGEQRHSAASWTRFVRASDQPTAVAELRYNDAAGLAALGVIIAPPVDAEEITVRETADPFPGDPEFSRPPAGIR